jgi:hypothetical protein
MAFATQDGTVNDNIVKQVKGRSLQVVVGGKVVERSTELAYRTMIDNNDSSSRLKLHQRSNRDVMKPHLFGQKKAFTPEQNYKFRTRKLKDLVVDKLEPRMCPKTRFLRYQVLRISTLPGLIWIWHELAKKYTTRLWTRRICCHSVTESLVCTSMGHGGRLANWVQVTQ